MTVAAIIRCDLCGGTSEGTEESWGVMNVLASRHRKSYTMDICPTCVAKVRGWKR